MSKASRKWKAWAEDLARKMNKAGCNLKNNTTLKEYRKIRRFLNQDKKLTIRRNQNFESLWEHSLQYQKKSFTEMAKF